MAQSVWQSRLQGRKRQALPAVLRDARLLLLAVWLGSAVFFSFVLAPVLFSVLPTRELAGIVIGRLLPVLNIGGFAISLMLLVGCLLANYSAAGRMRRRMETAALMVMMAAMAVGEWVINRRIGELRQQMGIPIDRMSPDDPVRLAFGQLHGFSVVALAIGMLAAVVALLLIAHEEAD